MINESLSMVDRPWLAMAEHRKVGPEVPVVGSVGSGEVAGSDRTDHWHLMDLLSRAGK